MWNKKRPEVIEQIEITKTNKVAKYRASARTLPLASLRGLSASVGNFSFRFGLNVVDLAKSTAIFCIFASKVRLSPRG